MTYGLLAVFGAAGAVSRYWLDGRISDLTHGQFPWGTLVINIAGAFLLGPPVALTTERLLPTPQLADRPRDRVSRLVYHVLHLRLRERQARRGRCRGPRLW